MSRSRSLAALTIAMAALLTLAACNNLSPQGADAAPRVSITEPASGETVPTGQEVRVRSVALGEVPIERIDMYVNNELIRSDSSPIEGGQYTFSVVQQWVPIQPGEVQIKVIAYNTEGTPSQPAGVVLNVVGEGMATPQPAPDVGIAVTGTLPAGETPVLPVSQGTPAAVGSPQPNATTVEVFTPIPLPTATPGLAVSTASAVTGTVAVGALNVRSGPGETYPVVGSLRNLQVVSATGRNEETTWVLVSYEANRTGWVASRFVTWEARIDQLPVVQP